MITFEEFYINKILLESHQPNPKWYEEADEKEIKLYFNKWKQLQNSLAWKKRSTRFSDKYTQEIINNNFNKSFEEFKNWVNTIEKDLPSSRKQSKQKVKEGIKVLLDNEHYYMAEITSWEAAKLVGKGTNWCISEKDSSSPWESYKEKGYDFIYVLNKKLYEQEKSKIIAQERMSKKEREKLSEAERVNPLYKVMFGLNEGTVIYDEAIWKYDESGLYIYNEQEFYDNDGTDWDYGEFEERDANDNTLSSDVVNKIKADLYKYGISPSIFERNSNVITFKLYEIDDKNQLIFSVDNSDHITGLERETNAAVHYQFLINNNIERIELPGCLLIYKGDEIMGPEMRFFANLRYKESKLENFFIMMDEDDDDYWDGTEPKQFLNTKDIKVSELFDYSKYKEGGYK